MNAPLHTLDLRTQLPLIVAAVEQRTLQCYKQVKLSAADRGCFYAAPCAVGVCVPPEARPLLDQHVDGNTDNTSVGALIEQGTLACPEDQLEDWVNLQDYHDVCVVGRFGLSDESALRSFENEVSRMAAKYKQEV